MRDKIERGIFIFSSIVSCIICPLWIYNEPTNWHEPTLILTASLIAITYYSRNKILKLIKKGFYYLNIESYTTDNFLFFDNNKYTQDSNFKLQTSLRGVINEPNITLLQIETSYKVQSEYCIPLYGYQIKINDDELVLDADQKTVLAPNQLKESHIFHLIIVRKYSPPRKTIPAGDCTEGILKFKVMFLKESKKYLNTYKFKYFNSGEIKLVSKESKII